MIYFSLRKYNLSQNFSSISQVPKVYKCHLHNLKSHEILLKKIPRPDDYDNEEVQNLKHRKFDEIQFRFLNQWLISQDSCKPYLNVYI